MKNLCLCYFNRRKERKEVRRCALFFYAKKAIRIVPKGTRMEFKSFFKTV